MIGYLVQWAVAAVFLMFAVRITGRVKPERDTFGTAFLTSALLTIVGFFVEQAGVGLLRIAWPIIWLFVLKSMYGIGWLRAIGVAILLFVTLAVVTMLLLVPLGIGFGLLAVMAALF